jgi:ABC-type multidrug transport system ATPase subunit
VASPALRAQGLTKSYPIALGLRRRTALTDCDLEVAAGESVALLGPNGSGKSTLLRTLAGLESPDRGEAWIGGARAGTREAFRKLGFCPEESPFPHQLSARRCLLDLGALSGLRGEALRARADAMLERFGLAKEAGTAAGRLSRGQLRRLSIAQAFLHDPDVLLLDEPTSGLDALGVVSLLETLADARGRGRAILVSSHVVSDVEMLCSRAVILRGGAKVADGPVDTILGDPARRELVIEGLGGGALAAVESAVRAGGGRIVASRPARKSLAELFRGLWG